MPDENHPASRQESQNEQENVSANEGSHPHMKNSESQNDPGNNENGSKSVPERFCHYFTNTGRCEFEGRTKLKCRFVHKKAPLCHLGINCPKQKCMYTHPQLRTDQRHVNSQQGGYFLGNTRNFQQLNPWLSQFAGNISPYPWIHPFQNPNWQQQHQFR